MAGVGICWSADGRSVTFADRTSTSEPLSLYTIDLVTHQRARLTTPPTGGFGDTACAWSKDGRRLAFVRFATRYDADLYLLPRDGVPTRLASGRGGIDDVAWTPDDRSIVLTNQPGLRILDPNEPSKIADLPGAHGDIAHPSFGVDREQNATTLAFQRSSSKRSVWTWRSGSRVAHQSWSSAIGKEQEFPTITRDGQRLAFVSGGQVWTAGTGHVRQITFHGDPEDGRIVTDPQWSPDGRRLAFSVPVGGQRDIYLIDADGANSFRLTSEPSLEDHPSWSADGQWIYFRSDRGGRNHLWKVSVSGGTAIQATQGEAWHGRESYDGTMLYFVRSTSLTGLWGVPTAGGPERLIVPGVLDGRWDVFARGILYAENAESDQPVLRQLDEDRTEPKTLAILPAMTDRGFSASASGTVVAWSRRGVAAASIHVATWVGSAPPH